MVRTSTRSVRNRPARAGEAAAAYIGRLRVDHARLSRVMREVEVQRARLQSDAAAARAVLADALGYLLDYQHTHHHPREDRLFARVAARRPQLRRGIHALEREHVGGLRHARRLAERLRGLSDAQLQGASGGRLARELQSYVDQTRAHMRHEERAVFYAGVETMLHAQDWRALASDRVPDDPLEDPAHLARVYPNLAAELGATMRSLSTGTRAQGGTEPRGGRGRQALDAFDEGVIALVDAYAGLVHEGIALMRTNCAAVLHAGSPLAAARALSEAGRRSCAYAGRWIVDPMRVSVDAGARIVAPFRHSSAPVASPSS